MVSFTMADEMWDPYSNNIAYLAAGWGWYFTFVHFMMAEWVAMLVVIMLLAVWQTVLGLIDATEYYGDELNEGFNLSALAYGSGGVILAILLDLMWPPHIRETGSDEDDMEESDSDINF